MVFQMHKISVSVVYATKQIQWLEERVVPRGTSAEELLTLTDMWLEVDGLKQVELAELKFGVYSAPVEHDYLMQEGDRLEIYRPLTADPKEVRRQLALLGKTIGKTTGKTAAKTEN